MNIELYINQVEDNLTHLPHDDRQRIIRALRELFEETRPEGVQAVSRLMDDLGDPPDAAVAFSSSLAEEPGGGRGRVLGIPYDIRSHRISREGNGLWEGGGDSIFPPRSFGIGTGINLGAIAARMGLINPDDDDERAWAAAGWRGYLALVGMPATAVVGQVLTIGQRWNHLPDRLPTHWGISGSPANYTPTSWVAGTLLALAVLSALWTSFHVFHHRNHLKESLHTSLACTLVGWSSTLVLIAATMSPGSGLVIGICGVTILLALMTLIPSLVLRSGVKAIAKETSEKNSPENY